jgi:hypothetical protein
VGPKRNDAVVKGGTLAMRDRGNDLLLAARRLVSASTGVGIANREELRPYYIGFRCVKNPPRK